MAMSDGLVMSPSNEAPRPAGARLRSRARVEHRPQSLSEVIDLRKLLMMFRRHLRLFSVLALVIFALAAIMTFTAPRLYTATSQVMFDARPEQVVKADAVIPNMPATSEGFIDTEVEVLQSRELALRVVKALGLERDPMFNWRLERPTGVSALMARITGRPTEPVVPRTPAEIRQAQETAAASLQRAVTVRRTGLTYLVDIHVRTTDPVKSAAIANAYAAQYVENQVETRVAATSGANQWLVKRLRELEPELASKEAAVARYRQANNLLSASGATLAEQEISNYNQRLADAKAELATEQARLSTARNQLSRGSLGDDVGEALGSPVIQGLRGQRAAASAKLAELRQRYGPRHPDLVRAQEELADIDKQIQTEIGRVMSNLEAKVQVAQGRASSIAGSLGSARGGLSSNNSASVELNRLERDAQVARADYEGLLARYRETSTQAGLAEADAQVASSARIPTRPSSPNIPLNLTLGLALAFAVGAAGVGVAESMDEGLTTAEDVEKRLGVPALGSIPLLSSVAERRDRNLSPAQYLIMRPLSAYAESFRALRTSLLYGKLEEKGRTIAVTSALPAEGKTTVSLCLGRSAAQAGLKVVVVDCDLRRRSLNRALGVDPKIGLLEVIDGKASLDDALIEDDGGALVLPIAGPMTGDDIFGKPAAERLLKHLADTFDVVILDTPPVLAVSDTRILALRADAVLFLTRWRKTSTKAAETALGILSQGGVEVEGVVLNQVDLNEQSRYGYGDPGYYYPEIRKYYRN